MEYIGIIAFIVSLISLVLAVRVRIKVRNTAARVKKIIEKISAENQKKAELLRNLLTKD